MSLSILIAGTLGSILGGLATPTEAAAMGRSAACSWLSVTEAQRKDARQCGGRNHADDEHGAFPRCSNVFGAVFARLDRPI